MSPDPLIELAPLAALGALDGEERDAFAAHSAACAGCKTELTSHEAVAARLAQATLAVEPSLHLRPRLLAMVDPSRPAGEPSRPASGAARRLRPGVVFPAFAAAAALVLGVEVLTMRAERDEAIRAAEQAHEAAQGAAERESMLRRLGQELVSHQRALGAVLAHPDTRVTELKGLQAAPAARGRVVWNPGSRAALLAAAGLDAAPAGRAYQVWVIARSEPTPAGVFQVDADGHALFSMPALAETSAVTTFAVTLEPADGVPAPTGPMVLAGSVS